MLDTTSSIFGAERKIKSGINELVDWHAHTGMNAKDAAVLYEAAREIEAMASVVRRTAEQLGNAS